MSAAADRIRKAAAAVKAAEKDNLSAILAPRAHEASQADDKQHLAEKDQRFADNAVAVAMGLPEHPNLPDAQEMEKLRAKIAVAHLVEQQLDSNKKSAEIVLTRAKRELSAAKEEFLHDVVIAPTLEEFRNAFDVLGETAVRLMAAHREAYPNENEGSWNPSHAAAFGPVAELLTALHGITWPSAHRYNVRPDWLPANGRFYVDEMSGFSDAQRNVRAVVSQELAA